RMPGGDELKTAMLVFESLPVGSSIAFAGGQHALAGEDGRATVPLAPGTHELEVTDPSGRRKRETVTITDQEVGSFKTVAMAQMERPTANALGAPLMSSPQTPAARGAAPVPAPAPSTKPGKGGRIAAVVSVVIFAALSAAAFIVIRGPGKAPQQQIAAEASANAGSPSPTPALTPGPQTTTNAVAAVPSPTTAPS